MLTDRLLKSRLIGSELEIVMEFRRKMITVSIRKKKYHFDPCDVALATTVIILTIVIFFLLFNSRNLIPSADSADDVQPSKVPCKCSNILDRAVKGNWAKATLKEAPRSYPLSPKTDKEIRKKLRLPEAIYREDLRCGWEHPLKDSTLPSGCNASSQYHCCNEKFGWCGNTSEHCNAEKSVNYRDLVSSNQAIWQQEKGDCQLIEISRKHACDLLSKNNINLIFLGDSEARKFAITFLLFLTGDISKGVIRKDATAAQAKHCRWDLQLLNDDCLPYVYDSSIFLDDAESCGYSNSFLVEFFPDYNTFLTSRTAERINSLLGLKNTYIILNSGAHFNANPQSFLNYYLRFFIELTHDKEWPKLIVETLPRTPSFILSEQRRKFKDEVKGFCSTNKVSVFDNFDLGKNLSAYDGKHYRLSYYMQKVKMLLNHVKIQTENCQA